MTIGLGIDEKDQVWIIHRGNDPGNIDRTEFAFPSQMPQAAGAKPPAGPPGAKPLPPPPAPGRVSECCVPAPPVVAFDQGGNVVQSWGGPTLHPDWPESNHGIVVDHKGIVWVGGNGGPDSHILRFTREGKFVDMIGKKGARAVDGKTVANSNDPVNFGRVAKIFIDPKANEAYVADGANEHVYVVDRQSLEVVSQFGTGGRAAGQFLGVHSIATDSKGNIYTTETWEGKRLQRFVYKGMGPVNKQHQGVIWPGSNATK